MSNFIDLTSDDDNEGNNASRSTQKKSSNKQQMISEMLMEALVENRQMKVELEKERNEKKALVDKVTSLTNDLNAKNFELSMFRMSTIKCEDEKVKHKPSKLLQNPMRSKTPKSAYSKSPKRLNGHKSPKTPSRRLYDTDKTPLRSSYKTPSSKPCYDFPLRTKTPSRPLYSPPKRERTLPPGSPPSYFKSIHHRSPPSYYNSNRTPPPRRKSFYQSSYKSASKFQRQSPFKKASTPVSGPKYIVENIDKGIEDSALYDYFKGFGDIHRVNVREKGFDQQKVEKCTAFLQFCSAPKEDFLTVSHAIEGSTLNVREFIDEKDTEKIIDDWGSDELQNSKTERPRSRSASPPRKYQRYENYRGRSEVRHNGRTFLRRQSRYQDRSRSSSVDFKQSRKKTRTIAVVLMFQDWTEGKLHSYFSKFGEIDELKRPKSSQQRYVYIRYKEYSDAEKALSNSDHFIEGEKYSVHAASDY